MTEQNAIGPVRRGLAYLPISKSRLRNKVRKFRLGKKTLLFRRGYFSNRRIVPFVEHGPFGCWQARWSWGELGWELTRWL